MKVTYLGIGTPDSKVNDPRGKARSAMAVTGVAGLKLETGHEVTNLFELKAGVEHDIMDINELGTQVRGMKTVLSVWMKHLYADKRLDSINNQTPRTHVKNTNFVCETSPADCGRFAQWGNNGMLLFLRASLSSGSGRECSCVLQSKM